MKQRSNVTILLVGSLATMGAGAPSSSQAPPRTLETAQIVRIEGVKLQRCHRRRLLFVSIHFDRPAQQRERELGELPLAALLDIDLSHHKGIGDFVSADYGL